MDPLAVLYLLLALSSLLKGSYQVDNYTVMEACYRKGVETAGVKMFRGGRDYFDSGNVADKPKLVDIYMSILGHPLFDCNFAINSPNCGRCQCHVKKPLETVHQYASHTKYPDADILFFMAPRWDPRHRECYKYADPTATLWIGTKKIVFEGTVCPKLTIHEDTNVVLQVTPLPQPIIKMSFDDEPAQTSRSETGFLNLTYHYDRNFPKKKLTISYGGPCTRTVYITCKIAQKMDLELQPTSSCHDAYVAKHDIIHLTGSLYLLEADASDFDHKLNAYLGYPDFSIYYFHCGFNIARGHCVDKSSLTTGCWCSCVREGRRVFDIHIKIRANTHMNKQVIKLLWRSNNTAKYHDLIYLSSRLLVVDQPRPAVIVNGVYHTILKSECSMRTTDTILKMYWCTGHKEIPRLVILFGVTTIKVYDGECGETIAGLHPNLLGKMHIFAYTKKCVFPTSPYSFRAITSESCKPQAMDSLLALMAIGYLFMTTIEK